MDENFNSNYQDNTANMPYQAPEEEVPHGVNGFQITSLVLGICSIVLCCCGGYIGLVLSVLGIVFAVIGGKKGKHGVGTAGLVCSIIGLVFAIIVIAIGMIPTTSIFDSMGITEQMLRDMGYTEEMLEQIGY